MRITRRLKKHLRQTSLRSGAARATSCGRKVRRADIILKLLNSEQTATETLCLRQLFRTAAYATREATHALEATPMRRAAWSVCMRQLRNVLQIRDPVLTRQHLTTSASAKR